MTFGCDAGAEGRQKRRTATAPRGGQRQARGPWSFASCRAANPNAAPRPETIACSWLYYACVCDYKRY